MKIIIDAMGGDNAPQAQIKGAVKAINDFDVDIVFVGKENVIKKELSKYEYPHKRVEIVNADEVITNHEEPAKAVRSKKKFFDSRSRKSVKKRRRGCSSRMRKYRSPARGRTFDSRQNKGCIASGACNTASDCKRSKALDRCRGEYQL